MFTPKGAVVALPVGSTPVDFAYSVHTQVGERCVGALQRPTRAREVACGGSSVQAVSRLASRSEKTEFAEVTVRVFIPWNLNEAVGCRGNALLLRNQGASVVDPGCEGRSADVGTDRGSVAVFDFGFFGIIERHGAFSLANCFFEVLPSCFEASAGRAGNVGAACFKIFSVRCKVTYALLGSRARRLAGSFNFVSVVLNRIEDKPPAMLAAAGVFLVELVPGGNEAHFATFLKGLSGSLTVCRNIQISFFKVLENEVPLLLAIELDRRGRFVRIILGIFSEGPRGSEKECGGANERNQN